MATPKMTLGQYISARRRNLRLTQEQLAERLKQRGIDRAASTVANWEADRGEVPVDILDSLAEALEEASPTKFYDLAGLLEKMPGAEIVRLLSDAPIEDIQTVERIVRAYLQKENQQKNN